MSELAKLALNTATLGHNLEGYGAGWSPERVIDECKLRGLGGVTFWRREIKNAARIGDYAQKAEMPIIGLCRTPYLIGREANLDDLQASFDMAEALNAGVLTIVVGGVEPETKGIQASLGVLQGRLEMVVPMAERAGVMLALEPLHPVYAGNRSALVRTQDAVDLVNKINHPLLKIAIDVYHVWWDLGLAKALAQAKGKVAGFHLCDWHENTTDILLDRAMMGDGIADIKTIAKLVAATGYDGAAEVEIFSKNNWWKRDPAEVLDIMISRYQLNTPSRSDI